jgi:hypothetical protein
MTRSFSSRVVSLDRRLLSLVFAVLVAGAPASTFLRADAPDLPFSFKATEEKIDSLPDYMGPNNKIDMDFPFCPVKIDGEFWIIYKNGYNGPVLRYKGTNMEDAVRQPDGTATFPTRSGYILGGMWYDAGTQTLYAPLHCEVVRYPTNIRREVHLASSTDKGLTWKYLGPILTSPDALGIKHPVSEQSGLYWDGGDGDQQLYVDAKGGYAYLYTNHYFWPKVGANVKPVMERRVARCSLDDKLAPGKWKKWYDGAWSEPGIGGRGSAVNADVISYNTYLKKYVSFNGASSLAFCNDLAEQDWTPSYAVGPYWCSTGQWAVWPTDDSKSDTSTSGQDFYVYNFWQQSPGRRFKCEFNTGAIPAAAGFNPARFSQAFGCVEATPLDNYGYQPLLESDDSVWVRRARRVGCNSPELTYKGTWSDMTSEDLYEGRAKTASAKGAEVSFTFQGRDIYWWPTMDSGMGKAEVWLDGKLQTTVDCFAYNNWTPLALGFMKRGLPEGNHTLRIAATGEKNPQSSGTMIRSMLFEYGADTWRASDDFSSVAGKNQWTNLERAGSTDTDLTYNEPFWGSTDGCLIGFTRMTCGEGDAARKWIAPHDGTVRIEGVPTLRGTQSGEIDVSVLKNDASAWTAALGPGKASAACDISVPLKKGDALFFVLHSSAPPSDAGPGIEVMGDKSALQIDKHDGKTLKLGDRESAQGLYFAKDNRVIIHLPKPAEAFHGYLGIDANADPALAKVPYEIKADGRTIAKDSATRQGTGFAFDLNGTTDLEIDAGAGFELADTVFRPLGVTDETQVSTLPVQDPHDASPSVDWDPVVTYVK